MVFVRMRGTFTAESAEDAEGKLLFGRGLWMFEILVGVWGFVGEGCCGCAHGELDGVLWIGAGIRCWWFWCGMLSV